MAEHEKMLEKVRGLLAKAESTEFEAEADMLRAKADELMTKYAIELWQIEQAQAGVGARPTPETRNVSIEWWYALDSEIGQGLWSVFLSVAAHTRCQVAYKYASGFGRTVPIVGLPSDLAYFDMLFTHLFLQMTERMDPRPKPGEPLVEALGRMKEAGMKWEAIFLKLREAGYYAADTPWVASKMNYAGKYTQYCKEHGRERVYTSPSVYRRSFVTGFAQALGARLRAQREEQGQATGSMSIALRDISLVVREYMLEQFPKMGQRTRGSALVERKLDQGVMARGHKAGQEVSIMTNAPGMRRAKELGS